MRTVKAVDFQVMVDANNTDVIGLVVNPDSGDEFVIPMARESAADVGYLLMMVK